MIFITISFLALCLLSASHELNPAKKSEYSAFIIASTLGMCILASAQDLILIFLAVLFLSVNTHFLTTLNNKQLIATEGAIKSLSFSSMSSAFFIYAAAFLVGLTHSFHLDQIHAFRLVHQLSEPVELVIFFFSVMALGPLLGIFPFSGVCVDLSQGSATPIAAFLSLSSRTAGFALATRFFLTLFTENVGPTQWKVLGMDWTRIISVISGITMLSGALLSSKQKSSKRMVGYLLTIQSGFLLMGLSMLDIVGLISILFNLTIEIFSVTGIFFVLSQFHDLLDSDQLHDFQGLLQFAPFESVSLILFLFSLAGSPPLPGFLGKFALMGVAIHHSRVSLALFALLAWVLATVCVTKFSYALLGAEGAELKKVDALRKKSWQETSLSRRVFLIGLIAPIFLSTLFADTLFSWANFSVKSIFE